MFLAGVDRSGIGLLGELLDSHPALAITRRTNFWQRYYGRFGDLRDPGNVERCVGAMMQNPRIRALHPDVGNLLDEMHRAEPTYGRLLAAIEEQHLRRVGKTRWGDKSLDSEGHAETIFREFPTAAIIHVIRDPRDRYASHAMHRRASRGRVGAGTALWLWSARCAERGLSRHPDRYHIVRYEELVERPEEVLADLCDFIGVDFATGIVSAPTEGGRAITTASVGRFRTDLTPREVEFMELVAGRRMRKLGYSLEADRLPAPDRIAFTALDLPVNIARMLAWRAGRAVTHRSWGLPPERPAAI